MYYHHKLYRIDVSDVIPTKPWWMSKRAHWIRHRWTRIEAQERRYRTQFWREDFEDWFMRGCEGSPPPTTTHLDIQRRNLKIMEEIQKGQQAFDGVAPFE